MDNNQNAGSGGIQLPKEFFTAATFGTVAGCVVIVWFVSGVLTSVFGIEPKIIGFIVSIVVAYVGLFLSKKRKKTQYVVTFFNGCLIYATVVGGTAFLPYVNNKTAKVVQKKSANVGEALATPWIPDPNLVNVTKTALDINKDLVEELSSVETQVDIMRRTLTPTRLPSQVQQNDFIDRLNETKLSIRKTDSIVTTKTDLLIHWGVKPLYDVPESP